MQYKNIVFDIDGTLLDTEYAVLHSLQDTLKELCNYDLSLEEMTFALGITGADALKKLNVPNISLALKVWDVKMQKYKDSISLFEGMKYTLEKLVSKGYTLGIVTSKTKSEFEHDFNRFQVTDLFDVIICADDTVNHKPHPEPLYKYMELSHAKHNEILYIGDSKYDKECANNANIDFALAQWGAKSEIQATYYLSEPIDLLLSLQNNTELTEPWLKWAMEIQSLSQCGLTYSKDAYDIEQYERLRHISAEMLSYKSEMPMEKIKNLFCNEQGYQTPKLDTRAVIFKKR